MSVSLTTRRNHGRGIGGLFGGGIGALVGLGIFIFGVWSWNRVRSAESWPTAPGVVDSSTVTSSHSRKGGTKYRCKVTYHFDVNGQHFTGDNLEPTGSSSSGSSSSANAKKAQYAAGKPCTVHYDPADPSVSCLELGGTGGAWIFMGMGALFGIGSAFAIAKSVLGR